MCVCVCGCVGGGGGGGGGVRMLVTCLFYAVMHAHGVEKSFHPTLKSDDPFGIPQYLYYQVINLNVIPLRLYTVSIHSLAAQWTWSLTLNKTNATSRTNMMSYGCISVYEISAVIDT